MLEMVSGAVPELVRVTLCAELVVVISCPAKVRLVPDSVTAGATPVPASEMLCGLPDALSVTDSEALRAPVAVGLNVMLIVQFAPAATLEPHVLVSAKSPLFAPVMAMPEPLIVNAAVPVFVRVTVCAVLVTLTNWFPKLRLVVPPKLTMGAVPVPVRETVCGLPEALSAMETAALRLPVAVGLKVTLIVQLAPAATLAPQVLV